MKAPSSPLPWRMISYFVIRPSPPVSHPSRFLSPAFPIIKPVLPSAWPLPWPTIRAAPGSGRPAAGGARRQKVELTKQTQIQTPGPGTAPPFSLRCPPPHRIDEANPNPDAPPGTTPPLALRCRPQHGFDKTNPNRSPRPDAAPPPALLRRPQNGFDKTNPIPNPRPNPTPPPAVRAQPQKGFDQTNPNPPPAPPSETPPKPLMLYWEFPHAT
jgi:hypothetical protein